MGTPLKSLSAILSPRLFTPKSPNVLLNVPKSAQFLSVISSKYRTSVAKNLFVETKPVIDNAHFKRQNLNQNFLIDTPNKFDLLRKGADDKILNVLGKGTFGTVFKATFKDATVAAKIVSKDCAKSEQNALTLTHKNIVDISEIITNDHEKYALIIMEYLKDTKDLQYFLNGERNISFNTVLNFARDITSGLAYCHENGILHLDLKPKNILVCGNLCKICDFGNSVKILEASYDFQHQGTVPYAAPEILIGKSPSEKSDIYSLGIIFWQLRHRKNPYEAIDNNETIIYRVVKCHLRPTFQKTGDSFEKLYVKCWDSRENERPDATAVLKTLREF